MSDRRAFIVCESLVKIFKISNIEVLALQGLDLTVYDGELIAVVGASGSGKSSLMNVLGGLTRPSAGKVWVDGHNLLTLSPQEVDEYRQTHVGFVWQHSLRNLIPYLSAIENVMLPMTMAGVGGSEVKKRATNLLELVNLHDRLHHKPMALSGGEQQRVAIAVSLANQPRLLLADEPTGELDSATANMVYDTFKRLNRELGLTTIIVSHDPLIAQHVGRVVAIRDGKTATETVRKRRDKVEAAETHEEQFEELTMLDSAGRLQIPKDYRERLAIQGRVRLEITDDGILIRPVTDLEQSSSQATIPDEIQVEGVDKEGGWLSGLSRMWQRKK
jgi:putative ABC transport system ATP-binding protein